MCVQLFTDWKLLKYSIAVEMTQSTAEVPADDDRHHVYHKHNSHWVQQHLSLLQKWQRCKSTIEMLPNWTILIKKNLNCENRTLKNLSYRNIIQTCHNYNCIPLTKHYFTKGTFKSNCISIYLFILPQILKIAPN